MPHVLIAGSTGANEIGSLNVLVTNLLMRNSPDEVRLIVDPKRVELTHHERPPPDHPGGHPPKRASEALAWAVQEMEPPGDPGHRRGPQHRRLQQGGQGRHPAAAAHRPASTTRAGRRAWQRPTLPAIVVVIDELST